jgi:hypothetical protein
VAEGAPEIAVGVVDLESPTEVIYGLTERGRAEGGGVSV